MTQQNFGTSFNPQQWLQACCAPFAAQTAYWQTVQNVMQNRAKTLQTLGQNNMNAWQGMCQAGSMPNAAAIFTAWWGQNARDLANSNADVQSAANHLWEQWQQAFPALNKNVWAQQYKAFTQASQQNSAFDSQWAQAFTQACCNMGQQNTTTGTTTQTSQKTNSSKASGTTSTMSTADYVHVPGTFIPGKASSTQGAGPTVAGTAPKTVAKPAQNQAILNTDTVTAATKVTREATTALADNTVPAKTAETEDMPQLALVSSDRKRQTAGTHAAVAATAGVRRSVVARRTNKSARRVAR